MLGLGLLGLQMGLMVTDCSAARSLVIDLTNITADSVSEAMDRSICIASTYLRSSRLACGSTAVSTNPRPRRLMQFYNASGQRSPSPDPSYPSFYFPFFVSVVSFSLSLSLASVAAACQLWSRMDLSG